MKTHSLLFLCLILSACAASRENASPVDKSSFFTNVNGPSKESGDCGGYAFWLQEQSGSYSSGKVAEFEGGCEIYQREILVVQHQPRDGRITIQAVSSDPGHVLQFEGVVTKDGLEGVISHLDKASKKPVSGVARRKEKFPRMDYSAFRRLLP